MSVGILYVLMGSLPARQLHLAVSRYLLSSLWAGQVALITDSAASLPTLLLNQFSPVIPEKGKFSDPYINGCYVKSASHRLSPFDSTVLLDSDTIPVGDFQEVFPAVDDDRIALVSKGRTVGESFARYGMAAEKGVVSSVTVDWLQNKNPVEINTGVVGFSHACKIGPAWEQATVWFNSNGYSFLDEIPLHFVYPSYPNRILDQKYNTLPVLGEGQDVRIYHAAGNYYGFGGALKVWCNALLNMLKQDWCGIRSWGNVDPSFIKYR